MDALLAGQADPGAAAAGTEVACKADAGVATELHPAASASGDQIAGGLNHQAGAAQAKGGAGVNPARQALHRHHQLVNRLEVAAETQQLAGRQGQVATCSARVDQAGNALAVTAADADGTGRIGADHLAAGRHLQVNLTAAVAWGLGANRDLQLVGRLQGAAHHHRFAGAEGEITAGAAGIDQGALVITLAIAATDGDRTAGIGADQATDGAADRLHLNAQVGVGDAAEAAGLAIDHGQLQLVAGLQGAAHLHPTLGVDAQIGPGGGAGSAGGDRALQQLAVTAGEFDHAAGSGGADAAAAAELEVALIDYGPGGGAADAQGQLVGGAQAAADHNALATGDGEVAADAAGANRARQRLAVKAGETDGAGGTAAADAAGAALLQAATRIAAVGGGLTHADAELIHRLQAAVQLHQAAGTDGQVAAGAAGADRASQLLAVAGGEADRTVAGVGLAQQAQAVKVAGGAQQGARGLGRAADGEVDAAAGSQLTKDVGLLIDLQRQGRGHQAGQIGRAAGACGVVHVAAGDRQQAALQQQRGLRRFDHPRDHKGIAQQGGVFAQARVDAAHHTQVPQGDPVAAVAAPNRDLAEAIGQGGHVLAREVEPCLLAGFIDFTATEAAVGAAADPGTAHQLLGAQGEAARALQLAGAADEVHVVGGEADRLACRSGTQPARGQAQQRIDGQQFKAQFAAGPLNGTVAAYQGEPVTPGLGQGSQPADLAFPAVRPRVNAQGHVADLQGPQSHPQVGVIGPQGQAVAFDQADVATARAMGGRGRIERLHGGA